MSEPPIITSRGDGAVIIVTDRCLDRAAVQSVITWIIVDPNHPERAVLDNHAWSVNDSELKTMQEAHDETVAYFDRELLRRLASSA